LIFQSAEKQLLKSFDFEKDRVIVLHSDGWHHGIIGIVSSRLADKYNYPCVLISTDEEIGKGSCRSIKGFNLFEALEDCKELLIKYGGHSLAAGLTISIESIKEFREKINTYARERRTEDDLVTFIEADCEITPNDITIESAKALNILEPYGVGNATPIFLLKGSKIVNIISLSEGKHTKLIIENKKQINALCFGKGYHDFVFSKGDYVDVLFNLDVNSFRGSESVQLIVKDICLTKDNI
jgi:single-stranded-DNA-specific exonuclease